MSIVDSLETEAALPDVKQETFQTVEVATIAFAHGAHDMFFSFIPTIQPLLMEKLSLSNAQAGLFTLFLQGPSLLQPLIGGLADRRNLRWLIILAPVLSATMITLTGLAPSYGVLALLMLIAGFSTAGFHSIAPVMAAVVNAFYDLTGIHMYEVPLTKERVLAALQDAGIATPEATPAS